MAGQTGSAAEAQRAVRLVRVACSGTLQTADESLLGLASELAVKHGLTVYDAAYVAAARERGWALVSGDEKDLVKPGFGITPEAAIAAHAPRR